MEKPSSKSQLKTERFFPGYDDTAKAIFYPDCRSKWNHCPKKINFFLDWKGNKEINASEAHMAGSWVKPLKNHLINCLAFER